MKIRFTAPSEDIAQQVADIYGGEVRPQDDRFEVIITPGKEAA